MSIVYVTRKLVPAEFVDITCPYPGDKVMQKFKEDERNRKAWEWPGPDVNDK
eukprot:jgi/Psemu1/33015/gm1.33015_g